MEAGAGASRGPGEVRPCSTSVPWPTDLEKTGHLEKLADPARALDETLRWTPGYIC